MGEEQAIRELETALGYEFRNPELLVCALTHRSLTRQIAQGPGGEETPAAEDNERLEFLGDAVLNLVVAEALFELYPQWREGELTRVRAQLVSRQHMEQVALAVGLGEHLRLSKGEERSGLRNKSTVLSNSMEAVIGALFLDAGLEPVRRFARSKVMGEAVKQLAQELHSGEALGNYKSALQEMLQATHAGTPVYRVKNETGPPHRRRFLVEVQVQTATGTIGEPLARGTGSTKKRAEQDAARRGLSRLAKMEANLPAAGVLEPEQEGPTAS